MLWFSLQKFVANVLSDFLVVFKALLDSTKQLFLIFGLTLVLIIHIQPFNIFLDFLVGIQSHFVKIKPLIGVFLGLFRSLFRPVWLCWLQNLLQNFFLSDSQVLVFLGFLEFSDLVGQFVSFTDVILCQNYFNSQSVFKQFKGILLNFLAGCWSLDRS